MLQQTQVVTVVPYFERFIRRFPTVEALARATEDEVMLHWAGLGYYSRARNLWRAAQMVVGAGAAGRPAFPRDRKGWESLPGVGPYTAGAVLSIALDEPEAILDGNVERVLSRVHRVTRSTRKARGDTDYKTRLWGWSREWVAAGARAGVRPSVLNQALMELGAIVCVPKRPRCGDCPIASVCGAYAANAIADYPPRKIPKRWIAVSETVELVIEGDPSQDGWRDRARVLLERSPEGTWRSGLWDLPKTLPITPSRLLSLGEIQSTHIVTRHKITRTTRVWRLRRPGMARVRGSRHRKWVLLGDLTNPRKIRVAVGAALVKSLRALTAMIAL